jgi:hypothetical protein
MNEEAKPVILPMTPPAMKRPATPQPGAKESQRSIIPFPITLPFVAPSPPDRPRAA